MDTSTALFLGGGGLLLWAGGEALVSGSVAIARRLGLPAVLIGVVLMGFGTSTPELVTSVEAALTGAGGIALGNVIGSNTANILLILGLAALISPIALDREALRRDTWVMAGAALFGALGIVWGPVDAMDGALFLILLAAYLGTAMLVETAPASWRTGEEGETAPALVAAAAMPEVPASQMLPLWQSAPLALAGLGGVLLGASYFVNGAVALARELDVSEAVIGATVVAVGTSLPELVTSVAAARRGEAGLAVGNVVGSNIFNIFGVLGATALLTPIAASGEAVWRDLPAMLLATAALVFAVFFRDRIGRAAGLGAVALYAAYLGWTALG